MTRFESPRGAREARKRPPPDGAGGAFFLSGGERNQAESPSTVTTAVQDPASLFSVTS